MKIGDKIFEPTVNLRIFNGKLQQWYFDALAERCFGVGPYERPPNGKWVNVEEIEDIG